MEVHWLRGLSKETRLELHYEHCLRAGPAGQDAPPTKKVDDMIQTSYALLFKRNDINCNVDIRAKHQKCELTAMSRRVRKLDLQSIH